MGVFGNIFTNNKDNLEEVIIEIETGVSMNSITEAVILEDGTGSEKLRLKMGKKTVTIYIRTKDTARDGSALKHGPSLKIAEPMINDTKDIAIIIPIKKNDKAKVDPKVDKRTTDEVNSKYKDILKFVDDNRDILYDIFKCTDVDEYNELIEELINAENNKKYRMERSKNKGKKSDIE